MVRVHNRRRAAVWRRAGLLACTALAPPLIAGPVWANPQGAQVVAGQVTTSSVGRTTTINQVTDRAIVNWRSFSVGAGETTRFVQPGTASAILNRVTGGDPSALMGQITANGRVYLINPHGVVVGPDGRVDTAGFIASTLDVPDAAFLGGGPLTFQGTSGAGIRVLGEVRANDGDVVLVAANVENKGRIAAPNGQAVLGAGGSLLYIPGGDDVVIAAPAADALVDNSGTIEAASVQIKAAGSAYGLAVRSSGVVSATAVREIGGRVVLDGGEGEAVLEGAVSARAGDTGGEVAVTGGDVTLTKTASIDVSGRGHGDGGTANVLAARSTRFEGAIVGRGGEAGGDGGEAEVSGDTLRFVRRVDMGSALGRAGHLLLDPAILDIDQTAADAVVATLANTNVTERATATLTVSSTIASATTHMLELDAPHIAVNADISLPNATLRFLNAGAAGPLTLASNATITAEHISFIPAHFDVVDLQGVLVTSDLSVDTGFSPDSFTATNAANRIDRVSAVQTTTFDGDVALSSSTAMAVSGPFIVNGDLTLAAGGDLSFGLGTTLAVSQTARLASTGGAFVNNAGTGLIAGSGRTAIYTTTEAAPFDDGGLGYAHQLGVSFGSDPAAGDVIYVSAATPPATPLLTVTANSFSRLYGQADPAFTAAFSGGTAADLTSPVQFRIAQGEHTNVGSYAIVPFGAVAPGFDLRYFNGVLTVTRAPLTIAGIDVARLYGAANPAFTASVSGLVNGDSAAVVSGLTLTTTATQGSGVGSYAITPTGASAANYAISYRPGVLSVNPAPLLITVNDAVRRYAAANPHFSSVYTGLVNGDADDVVGGLVLTTAATAVSNVGEYAVTASGATAANYTISYRPGRLTITPAPLVVAANDASHMEGSPLPSFSASYTGLRNGDDPATILDVAFQTDAPAGSRPGNYVISPIATFRGPANYAITLVRGTLTVVQRPVFVQSAIFTTPTIIVETPKPPADEVKLIIGQYDLTPPDTTELDKVLNAKLPPVQVCNQLCYAFGHDEAGQEFDKVMEDLAKQLSGDAQPPISLSTLRTMLIFPDKASAIMGVLLPMLYTHLSDILAKPEPWTDGETAFVQQFASYMDTQRRAAANLALADYQAWAKAQHDERQEDINSLKNGDLNTASQIYEIGMKSLEPPIPPQELLQEIRAGMTLNNGQVQTVANFNYEVGQLSKDSTVLSTGEVAVKIEGVIQGIRLASTVAMVTKGGVSSVALIKTAPALKVILNNSAKIGSKATKAAEVAIEAGTKALKAAETAAQVAKAAAEIAEGEKILAAASKGLTVVEAIPVIGEIVAVIGDWVQVGIAADQYRQVADFNDAFKAAYADASRPTTVADLKAKMGSADGQQQVFSYLTAMMATGGIPPTTQKPTMTITQVSQLSLGL